MVTITQNITHESGIPLGGIGAGSVEIRPDGLFHEWQIFNAGQWSPGSLCAGKELPALPSDNLLFLIRTKTVSGDVTVRYLALRQELHDLYSFSWLKCVEEIEYEGDFPFAFLAYRDGRLPVDVEAEMFSPFIPNDSRSSGTPGFCVHFNIHNPTETPVEVSIVGCCLNPVGLGQPARAPRNRLIESGCIKTVLFSAGGLDPKECTTGTMAFSIQGPGTSVITGAFQHDRGMQYVETRYGFKNHSILRPFREEGRLPDLHPETPPALPEDFSAAALTPDARLDLLNELTRHPYFHEKYHRFRLAMPDLPDNADRLIEFLDDAALNLKGLKQRNWGEALLCSRLVVEPGAERGTLFTLAWHFPNHISRSGSNIGHQYEHWYNDALDAALHLNTRHDDLRERSLALPTLLEESTLDAVTRDALSVQLSTLAKAAWWTKDGAFGVWEGLGCCGFHTMDITYQGSFPLIALFPDLQKTQMLHGARFQREDGRIPHTFTPDFAAVDNDFDRVDMNPQFVMLVARDFEWTGDRNYLNTLWPAVMLAMDSTALLDTDGDGLPDRDTRRNTYDVWDFNGCPAYIASLWLGALKATVRLAEVMGDPSREKAWRGLYNQGVASFEAKLWNEEYYILWKDEANNRLDECCMSDQLSGDWFSSVMGWGSICDPERIRKALRSILHYNFHPDSGLINASYPDGVPHRLATTGNLQTGATWTGIEYTVASLCIEHGLIGEGLALVRGIHQRYLQAGRFWNHVECGGHYYRAMSSWSVLLSLSGFRYNASTGDLVFAPAIDTDECELPFFVPGAMGMIRQTRGINGMSAEIEVIAGSLTLKLVSLPSLGIVETVDATLTEGDILDVPAK